MEILGTTAEEVISAANDLAKRLQATSAKSTEFGQELMRVSMDNKTKEIGRFIFQYMQENNGRPPIIREICASVKGERSGKPMAPSLVSYKLDKLEVAGIIRRADDGKKGRARSIVIVGAVYQVPELPKTLS